MQVFWWSWDQAKYWHKGRLDKWAHRPVAKSPMSWLTTAGCPHAQASTLTQDFAQDCAEEDSEAALKQLPCEWIMVEKQDDP